MNLRPMSQPISAATTSPQASPLDISGFTVIKIVLASIDALVEKEVIPEVSEELSCTRVLVTLQAPFFCLQRRPGSSSTRPITRLL
jgi:hypothetical protein